LRLVALLRGINVGKAKRIAMADLRALAESLGHGDVRTLLNSGNLVFTVRAGAPARVARAIEAALTERHGMSARVTVLTAAELSKVVRENPLLEVATDKARLFVAFPGDPADLARLAPLTKQPWKPEALAVGSRAAYLWCPQGALESPLTTAVARIFKDGATTRNWATTLKLDALASP
jgi:uncharacterized protein (DUF1697 family)